MNGPLQFTELTKNEIYTFFLYKKGWTGILIDPLSRNVFSSKIIRRKDKIIQGLVGVANESYLFFEMYPYEYSTTNKETVKDLIDMGKANLVKKIKLNAFLVSELNTKLSKYIMVAEF